MGRQAQNKASRDLFIVSLDLDMILLKLDNIAEDLQEEGNISNYGDILTLRGNVRNAQRAIDNKRLEWDHENE